MSAVDGLRLLGYLLLLGGMLYFFYQFLPAPEPRVEPSTPAKEPARRLEDWARDADLAEGYAPGHGERVAALALALAVAIGLPEAQCKLLQQAALLHDVGAIDYEPQLFHARARLTQAEGFRIWEHAVRGARRALELTGSQAVSQWVRWHHERWDGLGYPDGLVGEETPLPARILRLADSADALLHERPYRAALTAEETLAELNRLSGVVSDPALTRRFVDEVLPAYLADQGGVWRRPSESPSES